MYAITGITGQVGGAVARNLLAARRGVRAVLRDASLLILDEPTTSLDAESARRVADALERLPRGASMLVITHDREFARRVADRVLDIADGRLMTAAEATA